MYCKWPKICVWNTGRLFHVVWFTSNNLNIYLHHSYFCFIINIFCNIIVIVEFVLKAFLVYVFKAAEPMPYHLLILMQVKIIYRKFSENNLITNKPVMLNVDLHVETIVSCTKKFSEKFWTSSVAKNRCVLLLLNTHLKYTLKMSWNGVILCSFRS